MSSNRFKVALVAMVLVLGTLAVLAALRAGPSGAQQGSMLNCPQAGKWAIAVWDGDSGATAADALATCGEGALAAAYSLDPQTQVWSRWFAGKPEVSNLAPLNDNQGVLALGGATAAAGGGPLASAQAANQMQNCPAAGKWSIAVWDGDSGATAAEALATCGEGAVAAAYSLDAQTQAWSRWFADKPDVSNLAPLNDKQGVLALGAGGEAPLPPEEPPPPTTSFDLIDEALAQGAIGEETALTYKVYAAFGDDRLPGEYRGDDSQVVDTMVVAEVAARFDSLSPEAQATLGPFLIPPNEPGSWLELQVAAAGETGVQAAQQQPCPGCPRVAWRTVDSANGKVKVWWQEENRDDEARARTIANEIDSRIWPTLVTDVMRREPLPDGGFMMAVEGGSYPGRGGDDRLDIFLIDNVIQNQVANHSYQCKNAPVYILLRRGASRSDVAHEIMHAIQWSYNVAQGCMNDEYRWLMEATATWAEEMVYHYDNEEHFAAWYLLTRPEEPLDTRDEKHEYGAYLFFYYLVGKYGQPELIRKVWEATERSGSLEAVNGAIPGGLAERWPEFALYNWNNWEENSWDYYADSDRLANRAKPTGSDDVNLAGARDDLRPTGDAPVGYLSARYYRFRFTDDNVRTIAFYNGLMFKLIQGQEQMEFDFLAQPQLPKGAKLQALVKINGQWESKPRDWTAELMVPFCRDEKAERLDELVLILTNSEYQDRTDASEIRFQGKPPTLFVSNIGCRWEGEAEQRESMYGGSPCPGPPATPCPHCCFTQLIAWEKTLTAHDVTWERKPQETEGWSLFGDVTYKAVQGQMQVNYLDQYKECGKDPCKKQFNRDIGLDPEGSSLTTYNYLYAGENYRTAQWWLESLPAPVACSGGCSCEGQTFSFTPSCESGVVKVSEDGKTIAGECNQGCGMLNHTRWYFRADPE